jgi:diketogulonate reductase-like aldo/keto reductase/catechol 2,3-dioxygenase-like lactoylglutathione lyase family enzyme
MANVPPGQILPRKDISGGSQLQIEAGAIPNIGLGTFGLTGSGGLAAMSSAIDLGYRHLDTAQSYETEKNVGEAIARSGRDQTDFFVTTKVTASLGRLGESVDDSLRAMRFSYADLVLIHWPAPGDDPPVGAYIEALARVQDKGKARLIGVSKFTRRHIDEAIAKIGEGRFATNQFEQHVFLQNSVLAAPCCQQGIAVTACIPLAGGRLDKDTDLAAIASKHDAAVSQPSARLSFRNRRRRNGREQTSPLRTSCWTKPTWRRSQTWIAVSGTSIRNGVRSGTDRRQPCSRVLRRKERTVGIFEGFGHIAFKVNDLDTSADFYNKIGFPEVLRLLDAEGKPWIVYHRISEHLYLELFPGGDGDSAPEPHRTGMNHFCLTVRSADEAEKKLADTGIALSRPRRTVRGVDGNWGMWIEDPDGNRIEIQEMAPNCIQFEAEGALAAGAPPHVLTIY